MAVRFIMKREIKDPNNGCFFEEYYSIDDDFC